MWLASPGCPGIHAWSIDSQASVGPQLRSPTPMQFCGKFSRKKLVKCSLDSPTPACTPARRASSRIPSSAPKNRSRCGSSAARDAAEEPQRDRFFGALDGIREDARRAGVQAGVGLSNEHFTNFFLENFPQNCIGVGERNWGPTEAWLSIDHAWIPGHPGLANHIARSVLRAGFDPAFSHQLELDHGVMTVYHELDPQLHLPLVPIVQNCADQPMMPLRRCYEFGSALGEAIRSFLALDRVALVAAAASSPF